MMKRAFATGVLAGTVFLTALPGLSAAQETSSTTDAYRITPLAENLDHPWNLTFMPDGSMLIVQLPGVIRVLKDGALSEPLPGVPDVYFESQGGLFEVLPDPDYSDNGYVYLSYAHGTPDENGTRVARARFDGKAFSDLEVIFDAAPTKDTPVHYGGVMTFLPDSTLLIAVGDGFDYREQAQRLDNDLGKIVRINRDGSIPEDNPFVDEEGARPEIWSYGHRNQQGLIYDETSGRVYEHEHGPQGGDEINIIRPDRDGGANYGWPTVSHGREYATGLRISKHDSLPGYVDPAWVWIPSIAPSGMAFYPDAADGNDSGVMFPEFKGNLLVGSLKFRRLYLVKLDGNTGLPRSEHIILDGQIGRIRDVAVAPHGPNAGAILLLSDEVKGGLYMMKQ